MKRLLFSAFWTAVAYAQGGAPPFALGQYFTNNGVPNALGTLCTYNVGTSTPATTWSDYLLTTANATCIPLNSAGRPQSGGVWLSPTVVYRFVLKDSGGVTIWTQDGISSSGGGSSGGLWTLNGQTIYNSGGSKVCIGATTCTTALALLDIAGTSSGTSRLVRIDDAGNSPGIDLFASGSSVGSYTADSAGLRLRAGGGSSQAVIAQGSFTIQDASASGATNLNVKLGAGQGSVNPLQVQTSSGVNLAWIDAVGRLASPLYNATSTQGSTTFKNSNDLYSVNGFGDLTANGQVNAVGTDDTVNGADGGAYKVNGTIVVDNQRNATFATLTCTGTPCGSGGGGGSFPVTDTTVLFYNNSTPTKLGKFDLSAITAATTRTLSWPDANGTIDLLENAATITGAKTFSAVITASAGVAGTVFNATSTGSSVTFQNNNSNFIVNGNGDVTAVGNQVTTGYITSLTWLGLKKDTSTPGSTPGGGNSAFAYKGGTSGLEVWIYDTVHTAWSSVDLGVAGTGIASINGQTGSAQTIAGTANQVTATTSTNTVTLSTPQNIATTSAVTFGSVTTGTGGAFNSGATGASVAFQTVNTNLQIDGNGNISAAGQVNLTGAGTYKMGGTTVIDTSRNGVFNNVTINGSCLGAGCPGGGSGVTSAAGTPNQVAVNADFSGGAHTGAVTLSLPQSIATSSSPTFAAVVANGAFNSTVTGGSVGVQVNGGNFQVFGNGNVNAAGFFNSNSGLQIGGVTSVNSSNQFVGGGGVLTAGSVTANSYSTTGGFTVIDSSRNANFASVSVASSTVINSIGHFIGQGVDVGANGISGGGYNVSGGFIGQNWNIGFSSPFTINGSGSFTTLVVKGGIVVSAF